MSHWQQKADIIVVVVDEAADALLSMTADDPSPGRKRAE
jgi:hypothetical protein